LPNTVEDNMRIHVWTHCITVNVFVLFFVLKQHWPQLKKQCLEISFVFHGRRKKTSHRWYVIREGKWRKMSLFGELSPLSPFKQPQGWTMTT